MGGRSLPIFENGRPPWLSDEFLTLYGDTRLGDKPRWMSPPEQPYGLNMAFRREVFDKIGFFDPYLGRIGTKLLSNEEKDYFHRYRIRWPQDLVRAGRTFVPQNSCVTHSTRVGYFATLLAGCVRYCIRSGR